MLLNERVPSGKHCAKARPRVSDTEDEAGATDADMTEGLPAGGQMEAPIRPCLLSARCPQLRRRLGSGRSCAPAPAAPRRQRVGTHALAPAALLRCRPRRGSRHRGANQA